MRRLWHLYFPMVFMAIDCLHVAAEPIELENLRKKLDMVDLRLASDVLLLRRDLDTERKMRIELEDTVRRLQEQMFTINYTCREDTDILRADLKTQQIVNEQFRKDIHDANYQNQISRNDNARLQYENNDLRRNIIVLKKALGEEKQWRKQTEKLISSLTSQHGNLQSELRASSDQVAELRRSVSVTRNQMDVYFDGISNQVCQLNPSYVNLCQNHSINKSSCCLRRVIESVQESVKVNSLKLSAIKNSLNFRVSFSARVSSKIEDINPWDTIVFSDVIHNEGNAYNSANGIFVAPIGGIYVFFSHILGSSRALETALKINEDVKLWLYSGDLMYLAPGSNMLVIRMNIGDSARMVKHGAWGDRPFYIHHLWSTFSGFLLSAG